MNNQLGKWHLIPSMILNLKKIPTDRPVVLLIRHSVREALPPGESGYMVPITEQGCELSRKLGQVLGSQIQSFHSSPLPRCIQTAEQMRIGAGVEEIPISKDRFLGDPGVYVQDNKKTGNHFKRLGVENAIRYMLTEDEPLEGMTRAEQGARFLVDHSLYKAGTTPGIHVFVTHDNLVHLTVSQILKKSFLKEHWPLFLEGALFYKDNGVLVTRYREYSKDVQLPLSSLNTRDVGEYARFLISRIFGLPAPARFFVAGGCFKSLITGNDPRDIDVWAPSEHDREILTETLSSRGKLLKTTKYYSRWDVDGWIVELGKNTSKKHLEELLGNFDMGLSAIGYEYIPDEEGHIIIHPLAKESESRKEVILLKPLVNWKYALATLDRMRRYASELNYSIPDEQVNLIWEVFENQTVEMKQGMLDRFDLVAKGGFGVREEALSRK
jgi:Histidine phosphatase superfamily (branch 1)